MIHALNRTVICVVRRRTIAHFTTGSGPLHLSGLFIGWIGDSRSVETYGRGYESLYGFADMEGGRRRLVTPWTKRTNHLVFQIRFATDTQIQRSPIDNVSRAWAATKKRSN